MDFNCFTISEIKGVKKKTIRHVSSDVAVSEIGDASVYSEKLFNRGALADGDTISSCSLNVLSKD